MNNNNKKLNILKERLKSSTFQDFSEIIKELRKEEIYPGVISLLAEFHSQKLATASTREIENFFNDLKSQELVNELLEAIKLSTSEHTRRALISACWQSGLDFSSDIGQFVNFSLSGDYLTAVECYTVIDQFISGTDVNLKKELVVTIERSLDHQPEEKLKLLQEILVLFK